MNRAGALAALTVFSAMLAGNAAAAAAATRPAWLVARAGTAARVDVAPWFVTDEPEAALTAGPASLRRDFTADAGRPEDVVYRPIGVRVRLVRLIDGGRLALVRGLPGTWQAFAPLDRLVPEIPRGTALRVAGGFAGYAEFYPTLAGRPGAALEIATGTGVVALELGTAPYDPSLPEFVRVRVRVRSGPLGGRTGWIGTSYVGVPAASLPARAAMAEKACGCLLVQFAGR